MKIPIYMIQALVLYEFF